MVRVSEIMKRNVITVEKGTSILEATKIMDKKNIGCVVVTERGKPVGIVTEKDILRKVFAKEKDKTSKVEVIMSSPLVTIEGKMNYCDTAEIMSKHKIRRLPVMEDGRLVGIITMRDLLPNCIEDFLKSVEKVCATLNKLR